MNFLATSDKLQIITGQACTLDVHASFVGRDSAGTTISPDRSNKAITTAATTDIFAGPGSGGVRKLEVLKCRNKHASTPVDVTVFYEGSTTDFDAELYKVTLQPGDTLQWTEALGFFVLSTANAQTRFVPLTADQSNSTITPTEVTGLSTVTGLGTFKFQYLVLYQSSITTTGVRYSVNHAGTLTTFVANMQWADATAAAATATPDQDQVLSTGAVMAAFAARVKSTAGWGTTLSVDTANADMLMIIDGMCVVTGDGELELWHGSETAAATTTKAGSHLVLTRVGN